MEGNNLVSVAISWQEKKAAGKRNHQIQSHGSVSFVAFLIFFFVTNQFFPLHQHIMNNIIPRSHIHI